MSPDEDRERISAARQTLRNGQFEVAARIAADVLKASPDSLDALEIKALVEVEQGDDAAAEQTLRSAIALAPDRRWPYADLTRLLLRLGRSEDSEAIARSAIVADPDNPDAHAMLGSMLAEREMLAAAAQHFERAIALAGRHPQLLTGLGRVLMRQGKLEAARPLLEESVAAAPEALEPAVFLAELEEREGRFEPAIQQLDRAEQIAAASGTDVVLQRSVLLERMGRIEDALALLDGLADLSGAALLQRGRLQDRLGRHAKAWNDWTTGKTLLARRSGRSYPVADVESQADALASFFDHEQAASLPRAGRRRDVPQPIFILGFPRSGTTLVEQILASHSAIRAGGELPFGAELREFAVALVGGEEKFPMGLASLARERDNWPELLRDFYLAKTEEFGPAGGGAKYLTDKMPFNEMWLPLLRIAFPESPMILVQRHPLDVLTSIMAHDMTHGFNCGYRLEDAARHLALMDRLLGQYRRAGFEVTHEVRYEALVADQSGETERLMAAIGLSFERPQLDFHERSEVSPTPSYAQVRQPLHDRSVGRWHRYERQLESAQRLLSGAIKGSGYPT